MKLHTGFISLAFAAICLFTACEDSQAVKAAAPTTANTYTMKIQIENDIFTAQLPDTPSVRALLKRLPFTITMQELNGNEKYHYLSSPLPTDARPGGHIQTGDLMLFGSDCLVLFYKNFKTSYSYTPIGRITNPQGLAKLAKKKEVTVSFSL